MSLKIILTGIHEPLLSAWKERFANDSNVTIHNGDITKLQCDAIVSPANSFGFMDGGLDYALSVRFLAGISRRRCRRSSRLFRKGSFS